MNKLVGIYNTDESFVKVIIIPFLDFLKGIHTFQTDREKIHNYEFFLF